MTAKQDEAIAKLREQQAGLQQYSPQWNAAEQLMQICRNEPASAELIAADLDNPEMSVTEAEKKIKAFADELHKKIKGNCVSVSLEKAEEILRKFYGLPEKDASPDRSADPSGGVHLDLRDFLKG